MLGMRSQTGIIHFSYLWMLFQKFCHCHGRFLVLVIDEAQGMTQREWMAVVTAISPRLTRNGARG